MMHTLDKTPSEKNNLTHLLATLLPNSHKNSEILLAGIIGNGNYLQHFLQDVDNSQFIMPLAAATGKISILKKLHEQGANLDEAFIYAAATNQIDVLKYLHEQGADINKAVIYAAASGKLLAVTYLHEKGANIHPAMPVAAAAGELEVLKYLHQQGVSLNSASRLAGLSTDTAIIDYFANNGCDLSEALDLAMQVNNVNVIKYLHERNLIASKLSPESRHRLYLMVNEINKADPIYSPSRFWLKLGNAQKSHLEFGGEENFKRTINQSYCNFIPTSLQDSLIKHIDEKLKTNTFNANYTLEDPDYNHGLWFSFYKQYQIFQGDRELGKELYLHFVSKRYEYVLTTESGSVLRELEEPTLGNPIKIYRDGKLISQDIVTSTLEHGSIMKHYTEDMKKDVLNIGELGAGYGRLAYVFLKTTKCRYIIFDIPPALHIAEWYLTKLFPEKKAFCFRHFDNFDSVSEELNQCDIAFFTPNQLSLFPPCYFDSFVTISSLHEMTRLQTKHFIQEMSRVTKNFIYTKQYWSYMNPYDDLLITDDEYIFPENYSVVEKNQDPLNPLFFEMTLKKKTPTVSIILCNYNHAHYLNESLTAICEQSHPADEIIVVDDGSSDNSTEVIKQFQDRYPSVTLLCNETNKGLLYSINYALKVAKGDFIVWAAADDRLFPNFLERNLACLSKYPQAHLIFSRLSTFTDGTNIIRDYTEENTGKAFDYTKTEHFISPTQLVNRLQESYLWMSGNTVLARRSVLLEMGGFNSQLKWHADWFAFYAMAIKHGACVIPETLAQMRERPNTYSQSGMNNPIEQKKVLRNILITVMQDKVIYQTFIKCPTILSIFGTAILNAFPKKIKSVRLYYSYFYWYMFSHQHYHRKAARNAIDTAKKIVKKFLWFRKPKH
jgi:putative sugar O-methyltransferase